VIKPNPEIYKILIKRYNIIPEQSLFIDDNEENVKSVKVLATTLHFKKPADTVPITLPQITSL
jgi:HAD superfamily hydrolase (TIGR01509 family)